MTRSKASVGIVRFLCQPSRFGVFRELPGQWAPTSPGRRHGGGREQMVQRAGSGNRRSSCGGRDAADEVEALRPHAWGGRGGEFSAYPVLLRRLPFSLSALSVVLGDDSIAELDGAVLSGSRSTIFFSLPFLHSARCAFPRSSSDRRHLRGRSRFRDSWVSLGARNKLAHVEKVK